jgi:hypothetical protein
VKDFKVGCGVALGDVHGHAQHVQILPADWHSLSEVQHRQVWAEAGAKLPKKITSGSNA